MTTKRTNRAVTRPQTEAQRKAALRKKYIVYGLGAGAVLGGGYLLYNYLQDRQMMARGQSLTVNNIIPRVPTFVPSRSGGDSSGFPLKRGARGELVRQLQQGLLRRGGSAASFIRNTSLRSDGTPDGVFGGGTEQALRAAGYATSVSESAFRKITGGAAVAAGGAFNGKAVAEELIRAANGRNLFATLSALQKMQSTSDYLSVRSHFSGARIAGVRVTTPVNALLSVAFKSNEPAKVKIRAEFRRMGLKQTSSGTWTLSGLGELANLDERQRYLNDRQALDVVVTHKPTLLRNGQGDYILPAVPESMVVGYLTNRHRGVAQILTENGITVYAPSQNVTLI